MHTQVFEQNWANKVSNGWKPDGQVNKYLHPLPYFWIEVILE